MKKKAQIKIKPKKIKANSEEWISIVKAALKGHKKDFSFFQRFKTFFRKNQKDPEKEICKEIILRMEQKKLVLEEAQQIALGSAQALKEIRKDLPKVLVYFLGGGAMLVLSIIFLVLRSPHTFNWLELIKSHNFIFWIILTIANAVIFYIGLKKRKAFEDQLMTNAILSQAATSYAYSRAPGKGGSLFEAYHYLEIIREKNKSAFNQKFGFNQKKN